MKGIINIGNSCYINSAIQMLFNCLDFRKLCIDTHFNKIINDYDDSNIFNPSEIKQIVANHNKMFANNNQHDSYEFMIYLLDIYEQIAKKSNKNYNKDLYNLFGIKTRINIKCKLLNCLHQSEHTETELFLNLPLTNDLSESYRLYKGTEQLSSKNDNGYKCDKCKKISIARKKTITSFWPNNLIVILKRFTHTNNQMISKDNRKVNIPLIWRHGYKLKGGIIHLGVYGGGHYVYFGEENNIWYLCNDSHINIINDIDSFMKNQGAMSYILLYVK
jgi:ubiquitin carboxyl-terminal hydrolase 36/42